MKCVRMLMNSWAFLLAELFLGTWQSETGLRGEQLYKDYGYERHQAPSGVSQITEPEDWTLALA